MPKQRKTKDFSLQNVQSFEIEDFVFVKLRGYPPWPAQVIGVIGIVGAPPKKYVVLFFGTHDRATVNLTQMFDYNKYKFKLLTSGRLRIKMFRKAVLEIDGEITKNMLSDAKVPASDENVVKMDLEEKAKNENEKQKSDHDNGDRNNKRYGSASSSSKDIIITDFYFDSLLRENRLKRFIAEVKYSLPTKNPNLDRCIELLKKFKELNLNTVLIKMHPELFQMLTELSNYVGPRQWIAAEFEENMRKIQIIRSESVKIFAKIKAYFVLHEGTNFAENLVEEINEFREKTKSFNMLQRAKLIYEGDDDGYISE